MPFFGLFGPPDIEKLKAKQDVLGLIKVLNYKKDINVRREAVSALGQLQDARAVDPLIIVVQKQPNLRKEAVDALGEIGDKRAVEPLITALTFDNELNVANALKRIGDLRTTNLLTDVLKYSDWSRRAAAASVLGIIGDTQAIDPLSKALSDLDKSVCRRVVEALGRIGDAKAIERLIPVTHNHDLSHAAIKSLQAILEHDASRAETHFLIKLADMANVLTKFRVYDESCGSDSYDSTENIDCSLINQLARQELIRRGEDAEGNTDEYTDD